MNKVNIIYIKFLFIVIICNTKFNIVTMTLLVRR